MNALMVQSNLVWSPVPRWLQFLRRTGRSNGWLLVVLLETLVRAQAAEGSATPPHEPFTWAAAPTDEIGIADAQAGTEITPSGSLYTGYGELFFMVGDPARRVQQRTRTLSDGTLPVVHYGFEDGAVHYQATLFSAALNPQTPDREPVNFIRIVAENTAAEPCTSSFTVAFCYSQTNDHRFSRPAKAEKPGNYNQPGVEFDPHWTYGFQTNDSGILALRAGAVAYVMPTDLKPDYFITPGHSYQGPVSPDISPSTPVLLARYALLLKAGERRELDFKMPVRPIGLDEPQAVRQLCQDKLEDALASVEAWWRTQLASGLQLHIGEEKVEQTFKASLMYLMLARDRVDVPGPNGDTSSLYLQTVNRLQYHAFWLRDGSHMIRAYDLTGQSERAAQAIGFLAQYQQSDGNFISQSGQHDGWGEALWAYGEHFQITGDKEFAATNLPRIIHAVEWLKQARQADPLHLLPGGSPCDDELIDGWGHLTGDNFYALAGLHEAIEMASALGRVELASNWQAEYHNYHEELFRQLHELAATNGGFMPACLDNLAGRDWGNLLAVYPHPLLAANDPLVTGTLKHALAEYGEGLMRYGVQLHLYLTMNNTETWIARGAAQPALDELYAILVHTSSTHAGWECGPPAWSTRDFGGDLAPHNWFGADYIALVRNMLLREDGQQLELFPVLSPVWTEPGKTLWMTNAPTQFGPVDFHTEFTTNGMTLQLAERFRSAPGCIRLHLPWYAQVQSVQVDGRPATSHQGTVLLSSRVHTVKVQWMRQGDLSRWSYEAAVEQFEKGWREHCRTNADTVPIPDEQTSGNCRLDRPERAVTASPVPALAGRPPC